MRLGDVDVSSEVFQDPGKPITVTRTFRISLI